MKISRLTALALAAAALAFTGTANAGIANTKHNMSTSGAYNFTTVGGAYTTLTATTGANSAGSGLVTTEICVFCHTPHHGNALVGPLWNRTVSTVGAFTTYGSGPTGAIDGEYKSGSNAGSLLCLSCHDGTQALDNMVNGPGAGNLASGASPNGISGQGASAQGYTWSEGWAINPSAGIPGLEVVYIGTDLRDDHPIMIQYGGGGIDDASVGGPTVDPDFKIPDYDVSRNVWYFDTGASVGSIDSGDLRLQTTDGVEFPTGTAGVDEPSVECWTCHDPHVDNGTPFLRISNDGSAVCLTCHDK